MNNPNLAYLFAVAPYVGVAVLFWIGAAAVRYGAPRWWSAYVLSGVMVLAAFLRFRGMTFQSLWGDELGTIRNTFFPGTFGAMCAHAFEDNDMPPLLFVISWAWFRVLGCTETTARLLPVLFGIAGVGAIFGLGRKLARTETGLIAAFLTAISAFHLYYSQELRPYSLLFLQVCVSFWALLCILDRPTRGNITVYSIVTLSLLYTHYYGLVILMAQAIIAGVVGWESRGKRIPLARAAAISGGVMGIGFGGWLPFMFVHLRRTEIWIPRPQPDFFMQVYKSFFDFPLVAFLYAVLIALLLVFAAAGAYRSVFADPGQLPRAVLVLVTWTVTGFLVPYVQSINATPAAIPRYFIVILPPLLLMAALAINLIEYRLARPLLLLLLTVLSALGIFSEADYYNRPTKEPFRAVVQAIPAEPGAIYITRKSHIEMFQFYFDHFHKPVQVTLASPEGIQQVLQKWPPPYVCWLNEARISGSLNNPVVKTVLERFFQLTQTIKISGVTAKRYEIDPARRAAFEALLQTSAATWANALGIPDAKQVSVSPSGK